jgi:hypothetical protein
MSSIFLAASLSGLSRPAPTDKDNTKNAAQESINMSQEKT